MAARTSKRTRSTAAGGEAFSGFDPGLLDFLRDLGKNNNKTWFEAHRSDYESLYVEPARRFVTAIAPGLAQLSKSLRAEPRVNGAIMRIHRDTRFSKDKTPYKTGLFLRFPEGDPKNKGLAAFGIHIHAKGWGVMGGSFALEDELLAAYRDAVLDARKGKALLQAIAAVEKAGFELNEPHYKRVPRSFDAEHPRAEWLRYRALYAHRDEQPVPKALFGSGAVDFCLERFEAARPIQRWLSALV